MNNELKNKDRCASFVYFIIERIGKDKGCLAALRRADNPATEYQSWEYLAAFNIDLSKSFERLPYATIAAAIAKAEIKNNGTARIGLAIAKCYKDGSSSDQAKAKLRRLLACNSVEEACRILRPLFSLIDAKSLCSLDYITLLRDLIKFHWDSQLIKSRWAQSFYGYQVEEGDGG